MDRTTIAATLRPNTAQVALTNTAASSSSFAGGGEAVGWAQEVDEEGNAYFVNTTTGEWAPSVASVQTVL
jgi:hypothetical protein